MCSDRMDGWAWLMGDKSCASIWGICSRQHEMGWTQVNLSVLSLAVICSASLLIFLTLILFCYSVDFGVQAVYRV
jgi:hypothetical protein